MRHHWNSCRGWLAAVFVMYATAGSAAGAPAVLPGFDALVEGEMTAKQVPGLALAVVKDGAVVYSRTYGFRDLERQLPVTPQTLFRIGSVTKSMTAAAAGILVSEGRLDLDQPVREYLPEFRLRDAFATERLTTRDMLSHRSGLPRHDMVWFHENLPREEYVRRLRFLEPSADLRSRFQYNNLIYTASGYLIGRIAGTTWEQFVAQRLFAPLGMTATSVSMDGFLAAPDHAAGYGDDDAGKVARIPDTTVDAIAPAGAVTSSLEDMTRYLQMYLNGGKSADGRQILTGKVLDEMQSPATLVPVPSRFEEIGAMHYGLGLFVSTYRGHRHVYHTGAYEGFNASLSWLPDQRIGVVILANHNLLLNLMQVITNRAFDSLLQQDIIDWRAKLGPGEPGARSPTADGKAATAPKRSAAPVAKPARPLAEYVGRYEHPAYGVVEIRASGKQSLELWFHGDRFPLLPVKVDLFETGEIPDRIHPLEQVKVSFLATEQGDVGSLAMRMESNVTPAILTKLPAAGTP